MSYNVLVIDDSAIIRKFLIKTLHLTPIELGVVWEAENGSEALKILASEEKPDLIFLDINMPIMNGIQFMEQLSEAPQLQTIPVILVSTEGSDERHERLRELGVKAILRKPTKPEILAKTVRSVLEG